MRQTRNRGEVLQLLCATYIMGATMRRYLMLYLIYAVGYVPIAVLAAVFEGAAYGRWGSSAYDLGYQFGWFWSGLVPWLAIVGIPAAAILRALLDLIARVQPRRPLILAALSGCIAVGAAAGGLALVTAALGAAAKQTPFGQFIPPLAFVAGAALYGLFGAGVVYDLPLEDGAPAG
jgi:hypothetical protein